MKTYILILFTLLYAIACSEHNDLPGLTGTVSSVPNVTLEPDWTWSPPFGGTLPPPSFTCPAMFNGNCFCSAAGCPRSAPVDTVGDNPWVAANEAPNSPVLVGVDMCPLPTRLFVGSTANGYDEFHLRCATVKPNPPVFGNPRNTVDTVVYLGTTTVVYQDGVLHLYNMGRDRANRLTSSNSVVRPGAMLGTGIRNPCQFTNNTPPCWQYTASPYPGESCHSVLLWPAFGPGVIGGIPTQLVIIHDVCGLPGGGFNLDVNAFSDTE